MSTGSRTERQRAPTPVDTLPFVSVVIPVFNEAVQLEGALDRLAAQTYPRDRFEVIVVDNGSSPPLDVRAPPGLALAVLREPVPGSARARNRGANVARGQVIACMDADCRPARGWLEHGAAAVVRHGGACVIAGRVEMTARIPSRPGATELHEQLFYLRQDEYVAQSKAATANLFIGRAAWDRLGGFDERLMVLYDIELARRTVALGLPLRYEHDAMMVHPARATLAALLYRFRRDAGGRHARLLNRFGPLGSGLMLPLETPPPVRRFLRAARSPRLAGVGQRAAVMACIALCHGAYLGERLRLVLGAKPVRA